MGSIAQERNETLKQIEQIEERLKDSTLQPEEVRSLSETLRSLREVYGLSNPDSDLNKAV